MPDAFIVAYPDSLRKYTAIEEARGDILKIEKPDQGLYIYKIQAVEFIPQERILKESELNDSENKPD